MSLSFFHVLKNELFNRKGLKCLRGEWARLGVFLPEQVYARRNKFRLTGSYIRGNSFASDESLALQSKQAISPTVQRSKFIKRHITLRERGSKFLIRHASLLLKMQNLGKFILPPIEVFISYCIRFFYYHTNYFCTNSSCVVTFWERLGTIEKHVTGYIVEISKSSNKTLQIRQVVVIGTFSEATLPENITQKRRFPSINYRFLTIILQFFG